jgi:hypothetical protein
MEFLSLLVSYWYLTAAMVLIFVLVIPSIRIIGPTEVGLVTKRFALRKLPDDNPVALRGEAGYQADLLMPGWHVKLWILYAVEKHPWVQVRAGEIGVVVAQVGRALPVGAKSAESVSELNLIADLRAWLQAGGQKGVQRPVLPPGSLMPIHPVGFLVITRDRRADGRRAQAAGRRRGDLHRPDRAGQIGRGGGGRAGAGQGLRGASQGIGPGSDGSHQRCHGFGRAGRETHARDPGRRQRRDHGRRRGLADEVSGR